MWAQLMTWRLREGMEQGLPGLFDRLREMEQPSSGLLRTLTMRDQADPGKVYVLVLFESEEKARAREQDPRRQEGMAGVRAAMAELFDGPPEFADLDVLQDMVPEE